jgi:acyl dehydratase
MSAEDCRGYREAMGTLQEGPREVTSTVKGPQAMESPIENRTFNEMGIGDTASLERTLTWRDIELFAVMSGDVNPAHVDEEYARNDRFHGIVAHGMWGASLISTLLGTRLPGPGTIYLGQTLFFRHPVSIGDTITVSVAVASKDPTHHRVELDCRCVNQRGETVIDGTATVLAPTEKVRRPRFPLPDVSLREHTAGPS